MKSRETYMQDLKQWLKDTIDSPVEEMSDFLQSGCMVMKNIWQSGKNPIISFESLHHFLPERKEELYRKICNSLKKEHDLWIIAEK